MFSTKEAFKFGWYKTKTNIWKVISIVMVTAAPSLVLQVLGSAMESSSSLATSLGLGVIWIAMYILSFIISIGSFKLFLRIHDGENPDLKEILSTYGVFWKYLGVSILYFLIVLGGFILLIVPGIIWCIKYSFATIIVIDTGMKPVDAIRESGRITKGSKLQLLGFGILMALVVLLGYIALFVGALVSIPVGTLAWIYVYRKLKGNLSQPTTEGLTPISASI